MNDLQHELKTMVIEVLALEDITPADIDSDAPLFGAGLGLDSIDALELGVAVRQRYGIKIDRVNEEVKASFSSISSLAAFIEAQRGQA